MQLKVCHLDKTILVLDEAESLLTQLESIISTFCIFSRASRGSGLLETETSQKGKPLVHLFPNKSWFVQSWKSRAKPGIKEGKDFVQIFFEGYCRRLSANFEIHFVLQTWKT